MMTGYLRHSRTHRAKLQEQEAQRRYKAQKKRMFQEAKEALRRKRTFTWGGTTVVMGV